MLTHTEAKTCTREEVITRWYEEVFPYAATYIHKNGGDLEDAREIFQEAIVLYYEKLVREGFQPNDGDMAYLIGIVRNQWLKHLKKNSRKQSLEHVELEEERVQKPSTLKLMSYLKQAGEKCMDLLQSFYYEKQTMKQMADRFGYTSERSATVQKYKCLEKVRDEVKRKSLNYEDFLE